jgi:hypothetical protein
MDFEFYNIKQVFVNEKGVIEDKLIKRTTNVFEANSFFKLAKELKPQDKIYMYKNIED